MLPEDTGKEDARETFKGNDGMDRTLLGKIDDGTLLITNYPRLYFLLCSFLSYLKNKLDRASETLQKAPTVLGLVREAPGESRLARR